MINEFECREIGGVMARAGASVSSVVLTEYSETIGLVAPDRMSPNELTPSQARKLARLLNRFAKRIEDRNNAT